VFRGDRDLYRLYRGRGRLAQNHPLMEENDKVLAAFRR
jgi:hypothetical protein